MTIHLNHQMHKNSLNVYYAMKATGAIKGRKYQILELMADGVARTDRQIMVGLGYTDMNSVRPRISEMLKEDAPPLKVIGDTKRESGCPVRILKMPLYEQLELFK